MLLVAAKYGLPGWPHAGGPGYANMCIIQNAACMPPSLPGFSIEMKPDSIREYTFGG